MTVAEAAKEIGLSPDAVYDLCRTGALGHRRIGPNRGRIVILPAHVAAYLERSEVTEANAPATSAPSLPRVKRPLRDARPDGKPFRHLK